MKTHYSAALLSIGIAAIAIVAIPRAMAAPSNGYTIWYYADEEHFSIVGKKDLTCEGHLVLVGEVTSFYEREDYSCTAN